MRTIRRFVFAFASIALRLAFAGPLAAQAPPTGTVLHLEPYAGYMVFGNFLNGPIGTSVSSAPGLIYGTQVGLSLSPNVQLIGNIGYSTSDLRVGVPFIGGVSVGTSSVLLYDAGLEYDFSSSKAGSVPFSPFVQAGVGALQYNINAESILTTNETNFAGNLGIGADVSIGSGLALRLMAKDYIGKFNMQQATGLDVDGNTTHNFALSAGLRFDF